MATIEILGVREDGTPRAPSIPRNLGREIQLRRRTDLTVRLLLLQPNGVPVDLSLDPAFTLYLTVRINSNHTYNVLRKTGAAAPSLGRGYALFEIAAADTHFQVTPRRYVYDIRLTYQSRTDVVVPLSPFVVLPSTA